MDWSLGHRDVKKKGRWMLRNELAFFKDQPWAYYIAAVANVVLRFSWVIYLAPHPATGVQSFIIAAIEASRRILWNFFRVEAEHIGNRDGYRVTRDVPLPYVSATSPEASGSVADDDDEEDDGLDKATTLKARFFRSAHALHRTLVDNLQPVVDTIFSPTVLGLGRLEDDAVREQREVENQRRRRRRGADDSSEEDEAVVGEGAGAGDAAEDPHSATTRRHEHEKRQRARQREQERRRRRRRSVFLKSSDESSSPESIADRGGGDSDCGRGTAPSPAEGEHRGDDEDAEPRRTRSPAGGGGGGGGSSSSGDTGELERRRDRCGGDADIGEEPLAPRHQQKEEDDHDDDRDVGVSARGERTTARPSLSVDDAQVQAEVAAAERMTERATGSL